MRKKFNERNDSPGTAPEFGAIFMSSSATKKECFRRRMFGLPSWQAEFVKQACSDGAMNIVPDAYCSSGRQFPAQVKFIHMWNCSPLCEDEFRDAIRENHFSPVKFNFGLSEVQVHRLLTLFSLKKVEKPLVQGPWTRTDVAKSIEQPEDDFRNAVGDDSFETSSVLKHNEATDHKLAIRTVPGDSFLNLRTPINDGRSMAIPGPGDGPKVGSEFDMVTRNEYFRDSSCYFGRAAGSGSFGIGKEFNMDTNFRTDVSTISADYSLNNIRSFPENSRPALNDRLENEVHEKDGYAQVVSSGYPSSWSNLNLSADNSKQAIEADPLVLGPPGAPLKFPISMDPENYNLPYLRYQGDTTIRSTLPDAPIFYLRNLPSSYGVNHNFVSVEEQIPPYGSCAKETLPPTNVQSFPQPMEPCGASKLMDRNFEWGDYVPLPNDLFEFPARTSMPGVACSERMSIKPFDNEGHRGFSLRIPFPDSLPPMETGDHTRNYQSYSSSPSKYLSFLYPLASQDNVDRNKTAECDNKERFGGDASDFKKKRCQIQDYFNYTERESPKTRSSVFTRLGLPSKECETKKDYCHVNNSSVDEAMAMLREYHDRWVNTNNLRPITKHSTGVGNVRMQRQKEGELMTASSEMTINDAPACAENEDQTVEQLTFIDFRRRSEVRKTLGDCQTEGCKDGAENLVSPGSQHKRRKLIRPNFSKGEPSEDKGSDDNPLENALVPSVGISVCKNNAEICEVLATSSVDIESKSCSEVESSQAVGQTGSQDGNSEKNSRHKNMVEDTREL